MLAGPGGAAAREDWAVRCNGAPGLPPLRVYPRAEGGTIAQDKGVPTECSMVTSF